MYIMTSKNGGKFERNNDFDNFLKEEKQKRKDKIRKFFGFKI